MSLRLDERVLTTRVTLGANDLLIAAHARALGLVMVTHNVREFSRVPGLVVEDWLASLS